MGRIISVLCQHLFPSAKSTVALVDYLGRLFLTVSLYLHSYFQPTTPVISLSTTLCNQCLSLIFTPFMCLGTATNPHRHCSAPGAFSFHTSIWLFPLPQQWDATAVLPAAQTPTQKQPGQHRGAGWPQPTQETFSLSTHTC